MRWPIAALVLLLGALAVPSEAQAQCGECGDDWDEYFGTWVHAFFAQNNNVMDCSGACHWTTGWFRCSQAHTGCWDEQEDAAEELTAALENGSVVDLQSVLTKFPDRLVVVEGEARSIDLLACDGHVAERFTLPREYAGRIAQ